MTDADLAALRARRSELARAAFARDADPALLDQIAAIDARIAASTAATDAARGPGAAAADAAATGSPDDGGNGPRSDPAGHATGAAAGAASAAGRRIRPRLVALVAIPALIAGLAGVSIGRALDASRLDGATAPSGSPSPGSTSGPIPTASPPALAVFDQPQLPTDVPAFSTGAFDRGSFRLLGDYAGLNGDIDHLRAWAVRDVTGYPCLLVASGADDVAASCSSSRTFPPGGIVVAFAVGGTMSAVRWSAAGEVDTTETPFVGGRS
ncbi:hypothetical protein QT381_09745 [Galbitalea sp. SE-J8]|uniref:hypothetical protein n=1 Tax=Galbitalea sp. SE-J8 TaxID=3054952 RepID=UPI00259CABD4|nr:hypothetical protein [Galbitalea sp. SE-J8]MDM4763288.1 hypothetical protein [Galbitalea sp. SE-J8]